MSTTASALPVPDRDSVHVWISICETGGWDISAAIDGHTVMREHCTDWHRVERRRAFLSAQLGTGSVPVTQPPITSTH